MLDFRVKGLQVMKNIAFLFYGLFSMLTTSAQVDSTMISATDQVLETVYLSGNKLKDFSVGQTLNHLPDSVIVRNRPMLTSLLQYNTPIYFKENGLGMASSPSFRGTTASHTAVLWNGININSNFLGQTDFNTINTSAYDNIDVRAGGGSLIYGSGAIGGTVHLNTELDFKKNFENQVYLNYGSFDTYDARYKLKLSSEKLSFRLALAHNQSDNDYEYEMREGKNTNGQFRNLAVSTAFGVKLNTVNQINLYNEIYDSNRHFPVYYLTEVPTKYKDFNTRSLVEWKSRFAGLQSNLKGAFWTENYKYFPDAAEEEHNYGKAKNFVGKYDLSYQPTNQTLINVILEHKYTDGEGSDVQQETRNITSAGVLFKHHPWDKFKYQLGIRQEITNAYGSPFLYAVGMDYEFTSFYTAKLSASKNFKRPTYNDLYWTNSGNPNLDAEKSNQIELGNNFKFDNWNFTLTGYYNDIKDMIHWLPGSNGLFQPYNEDHVKTYGAEVLMNWQKQFGKHVFNINGTYAYTVSKNQETKKQLIYVPYHKATFSANYAINRLNVDLQLLYNGEVYMRSDNDPSQILKDYLVSNLQVSYRLGQDNSYILGGKVNNLFDTTYENVRRYEMPGINYSVFVNLKF